MTVEPKALVAVTGASGGIGQSICIALAREGYDVVGQYRSHPSDAEVTRKAVEAEGRRCSVIAADLEEPAGLRSVCDAVDQYLATHGDAVLHGLVNNAALLLGPGFESAGEEDFDRYMAVNVRAPFILSQQLSRRMRQGGSIVNISSAGTAFSSPGDIVYAMSKSALEALTFHAAEALGARKIRINTVVPGFTDNGHPLFSNPDARDHMSSYAALGDVADPAVVADAVLFLLSRRSTRTTGSILDVSGGSRLGYRGASTKLSLRGLS